MKKLLLAALMMTAVSSFSFAQTKKPVDKKAPATETTKKAAPVTASTAAPAPAKKDANGTVLKKDGTPDKRYKSKKEHLKKDGTPDKRYKENKEAKKSK